MAVLLDKLPSNVKVKVSYWYKLHRFTGASSTVCTFNSSTQLLQVLNNY
jgi:hypothetical protein